jgi:hypothetical protein
VARFAVGQPITTRESVIQVDPGLKPGTHRFQLEVETADGRVSKPDVIAVTVVEGTTDPIVLRDIIRDVIRNVIREINP